MSVNLWRHQHLFDPTERAILEFEQIDFSQILKESFHATINSNKQIVLRGYERFTNFQNMEVDQESITQDEELSFVAGNIVSNALHIPRSLYCPICADEYMFEFTLKDHLKRTHPEELLKLTKQTALVHPCKICGAIFYHKGLIPKHIAKCHGMEGLKQWQQNDEEWTQQEKQDEPSIVYAACSPGLSDFFDKLNSDSEHDSLMQENLSPVLLKSILKKTPKSASRIISSSPSSALIRRSKNEAIKRSLSVRRELRFDLPPIQCSPEVQIFQKDSKKRTLPSLKSLKNRLLGSRKEKKVRTHKLQVTNTQNMITSTPIILMEDDVDLGLLSPATRRNWKATLRNNRPLFFGAERFQCGRCKKTFENNAELLQHTKSEHRGVVNMFRPHYMCGQCGATFYRNSFLVRHCHFQHTPVKGIN